MINEYDTVSYDNNNNNNMQTIAIVKKYFLFFLILIFTLIVVYKLSGFEASAISPSFSLQVINDSRNDWIDWTRKYPFEKDGSIDITRADYFSNGKTLNATIWLACEPERSSYIDPLSQCNKNNIQISVENLGSKNNITLNEFTNRRINKLNESLVNQIQSSEDTILAGNNPAHKIVYTTTVYGKQQDFETLQIWTVKDGKAYIIEYAATPANYANYKPIIQNMINSFDIGNIQKRSANIINASYSSYQNNTYGIRISYPRNWQLQQQKNGDSDNNNYGIYNDGNTATTHIVTFFPRTLNSVTYGMYMDADNNNKTGILAGIDYILSLNKADNDKSWSKQIQQWATPTVFRIIDRTDNYTGLFGRFPGRGQEEGSINLSVDLDAIGSPDNYRVIFFAKKGNATDVSDRVGDYTNWALIPPSKLEISVLPNPSEIRQEESKKVELQLKSNTAFDSQTRIFIKKTPGIDVEYNSNLVQIPPFGLATIPLNIIVSGNADIGPQTIPLSINSSFPTEVYQESSYSKSGFVNLGFKVPSTEANIVNQTSDLTVEIQKRLDAGQKIATFWKDFGGPISLIGGGFVGGFSGWIIGKVQRKGSKK
jgi:hypothetical protein